MVAIIHVNQLKCLEPTKHASIIESAGVPLVDYKHPKSHNSFSNCAQVQYRVDAMLVTCMATNAL